LLLQTSTTKLFSEQSNEPSHVI